MRKRRAPLSDILRDADITPFERDVYRAVARIPRGTVRSYAWVARAIGRPRAVRAVGNALHKNPFAPRVPCHRVIASDGTLGGFAKGAAAKRRILASEGVDCSRLCYYHAR